mmetsp:Transcript_70566/g.132037  ORF Transcript_70566/g.132037 Transcript_70566/m.132037 type:complete len:244 (+) Transcript_70566:492-1223(+)
MCSLMPERTISAKMVSLLEHRVVPAFGGIVPPRQLAPLKPSTVGSISIDRKPGGHAIVSIELLGLALLLELKVLPAGVSAFMAVSSSSSTSKASQSSLLGSALSGSSSLTASSRSTSTLLMSISKRGTPLSGSWKLIATSLSLSPYILSTSANKFRFASGSISSFHRSTSVMAANKIGAGMGMESSCTLTTKEFDFSCHTCPLQMQYLSRRVSKQEASASNHSVDWPITSGAGRLHHCHLISS